LEAIMKYLTEKEEKSLLKTVREIKGVKAERDAVIIELLLSTGLRAAELVGLNVGDLRGKEKLHVRAEIAKRSKEAFIPVPVDTQRLIKRFIASKMQNKESIRDDAPLFVSRNGERLAKRSLQLLVEQWIIRAGLTASTGEALYSVHSLRHTCFKRMQERGVQLTTIQKIARHASLASTGIYTEATWEEMVDAMEARG
jgi:site-specific recombinase XerD